jgi:hypothetical protein
MCDMMDTNRLLEELEEAAESVLATRQEIVDLDR